MITNTTNMNIKQVAPLRHARIIGYGIARSITDVSPNDSRGAIQ